MLNRLLSRGRTSAYLFVASLGIWLPHSDAATLVNLDATQLSAGPLNAWTNNGTVAGIFTSAGDVVPAVTTVDGVKCVGLTNAADTSGPLGTHYSGPQVPAAVAGANPRTVEAWILDPTTAATNEIERVIFGFGRRTNLCNFAFEHGSSREVGAVNVALANAPDPNGNIGWNGHLAANRWTYIAATYDGLTLRVYKDGVLVNSKIVPQLLLNTATRSSDNSTALVFRVGRQSLNNPTGSPSALGAGPFYLGRLRLTDTNLTAAQILGNFNAEKGVFNQSDTDGDGIPDWWEVRHGLNKNDPADAALDPDGDGASNLEEFLAGSDIHVADTDGDGINDGVELHRLNPITSLPEPTDPMKADTDGDGLPDAVETGTGVYVSPADTGTNPAKADTDGDTYSDGFEIVRGTDPFSAASAPLPLVRLDATALAAGPLVTWTNLGTLPGDFAASSATNAPNVERIDGVYAVHFTTKGGGGINGQHYLGPEAPTQLTGAGVRTVDAWVRDLTAQDERTICSWGRSGGPDTTSWSLGNGQNDDFGALLLWGAAADVGWSDQEVHGRWTHVAASYDGTTTRVYVDGKLVNSKISAINTAEFASTTPFARLHFRIARKNSNTGDIDSAGFGDFTIARVRVHDLALDNASIQAKFDAEKGFFNVSDANGDDADGDGLPDWYEERWGLDKHDATGANGAGGDPDGDGLTNLQEFQLGTVPTLFDTDGDGIGDGAEVNRMDPQTGSPAPTNPLDRDTDHDGLLDGVETDTGIFICTEDTGSDPLKTDTDGDYCPDSIEAYNNSDPSDPSVSDCGLYEFPITRPCPLINLDAARLTNGPLTTWPNRGTLAGDFIVPSNATAPSVILVDTAQAVAFQATGGAAGGTQFIGPEVPPPFLRFGWPGWPFIPIQLTGAGGRTVEAWVHDSDPQAQTTVMAWGRHGGDSPDGKNFSFGLGTNAISGAVDFGAAGIGWAGQEVFDRWTCLVVTYSGTNTYATNYLRVYVDGQPVNSEVIVTDTAAFAADAPDSPTDSTNRLHFRIARQNNDTGEVDGAGMGAFNLARLRVSDFAMDAASILARFNSERRLFQPPLRVETIGVDPGSGAVTLAWTAAPGRTVSVQTSTNLINWTLVISNLNGNTFTETPTNSILQRKFYRLKTP